ncbi:unnamed protein product [Lymnaea stagnalis]|uniref:Anoctamin n=1 Tax=Lymnaea stagnalis TaxID=6523 RepID=A0AAV2IHS4_LYMST
MEHTEAEKVMDFDERDTGNAVHHSSSNNLKQGYKKSIDDANNALKHGKKWSRTLKKHRAKHPPKLGGFEKRYSILSQQKKLVPERKRIDFVLVYPRSEETEPKTQHEKNRERFETLLKNEGFCIQKDEIGKEVFVKLHCPFKRLCYEAEKVKLEMALKDCAIPQNPPEGWLREFVVKHFDTDNEVSDFVSAPFYVNKIELYDGHENPEKFFRPSIRSLLVHHILINTDTRTAAEVAEDEESEVGNPNTGKCAEFCKGLFCCCKEKTNGKDVLNSVSLKRKGLQYLLMKKSYTDSFVLHEESALSKDIDPSYNYITNEKDGDISMDASNANIWPAPNEDPRKLLQERWTDFAKFQPMWHIRNYFGEKIAFYFAWTGMLITTLWIPMLFGIAVFIYGLVGSVSDNLKAQNSTKLSENLLDVLGDIKLAFDNDLTPFFALFICIWGTIFLEVWKRQNSTLAYEWDVDQFETYEPDRPQFYGTKIMKDPITLDDTWIYPASKQVIKFLASASVLIFMVAMVIISVFAVIVYRVIMNVDYCPNLPNNQCFLLTTVVSSILNALSMMILELVYNKLAVVLTNWENHRTQTSYDDSLIIKMFAFKFVNCNASCFYIAFARGVGCCLCVSRYVDDCEGSCMTQLSFQVMTLMIIKPLPKFLKDLALPAILKLWQMRPQCRICNCIPFYRKNQVMVESIEQTKYQSHLKYLEKERLKPDLNDFTLAEYLEKVILYGYLMLFACSFPLAPLFALVVCYIDLRIDAKRLLWWYRRPIAYIAADIGMWLNILQFVNCVGVVTNSFIIAFTSSWASQFDLPGKLWVVIGFEHIVFTIKFLLAYLIPDVPQDVQLSLRRQSYLVQRKIDNEKEKARQTMNYSQLFPRLESSKDEEDIAHQKRTSTDSVDPILFASIKRIQKLCRVNFLWEQEPAETDSQMNNRKQPDFFSSHSMSSVADHSDHELQSNHSKSKGLSTFNIQYSFITSEPSMSTVIEEEC